jgi:hypothetical protein
LERGHSGPSVTFQHGFGAGEVLPTQNRYIDVDLIELDGVTRSSGGLGRNDGVPDPLNGS